MQAIGTWNQMGEKGRAAGIKLYLHNHAQEWGFTTDTQERVYDLYWQHLNPETVFFEMDVYWAHVGSTCTRASSRSTTSSATRDASRSCT